MRHLKAGRKLGRTSAHRRALFSNLVTALVTHGKIETTEAKAKELRSIADRTIHWGVGVADLVQKGHKKLSKEEQARLVHAKRMARRVIKQDDALDRLFSDVAPQMTGRPGGYTRLLKTRVRLGDAAPMAIVQLVGSAGQPRAAAAPPVGDDEPTTKGKAKKAKAEKAPAKAEAKASRGRGKKSAEAEAE